MCRVLLCGAVLCCVPMHSCFDAVVVVVVVNPKFSLSMAKEHNFPRKDIIFRAARCFQYRFWWRKPRYRILWVCVLDLVVVVFVMRTFSTFFGFQFERKLCNVYWTNPRNNISNRKTRLRFLWGGCVMSSYICTVHIICVFVYYFIFYAYEHHKVILFSFSCYTQNSNIMHASEKRNVKSIKWT